MDYTLRQIDLYIAAILRLESERAARDLHIGHIAAQHSASVVNQTVKALGG